MQGGHEHPALRGKRRIGDSIIRARKAFRVAGPLWAVTIISHVCLARLPLAAPTKERGSTQPHLPRTSSPNTRQHDTTVRRFPDCLSHRGEGHRCSNDVTRDHSASRSPLEASRATRLGFAASARAGASAWRPVSWLKPSCLRGYICKPQKWVQDLPTASLVRLLRPQQARLHMSGGGEAIPEGASGTALQKGKEFAQAKRPELAPDVSGYDVALEEKAARVKKLLVDFLPPDVPLEVVGSPPLNYRMRAEFRVWHVGDRAHYAVFDPETRKPIFVEEYPLACARINRLMHELSAYLHAEGDFSSSAARLKRKLFQAAAHLPANVEMVANTDGDALLALVYKRPLDEEWEVAASKLAGALDCQIIGRSKGKKLVVGGDGHLVQRFRVDGREFPQWQTENRFSQSNAHICQRMLAWAHAQLGGAGGTGSRRSDDLLELYCGNGSFSLPLAGLFRKVVATELDRYSVRAAKECAALSGVDNIRFAALSAAEISQAMRGDREFFRLKEAGIELNDYSFGALVVDPPRAGLDLDSAALATGFDEVQNTARNLLYMAFFHSFPCPDERSWQILYVSCNPANLARDLSALPAAALFDQFPWTEHAEVAVRLVKD